MHTAHSLSMRDPALAAFVGAIDGTDFGDDLGYAPENFTNEFQQEAEVGADFGSDDFGASWDDYGIDFGIDFGQDASAAPMIAAAGIPKPTQTQALQLWRDHHVKAARENQRMQMIEPNRGLSTKVERYFFSINQTVTIGTAVALKVSGAPDSNIRPQRFTVNAPMYGFITVDELKVANVSVSLGGTADAYDFNANGVGQTLDMPTLTPANKATLLGNYTGTIPPAFISPSPYLVVVKFNGPATMAA